MADHSHPRDIAGFPVGFFRRTDESPDDRFYVMDRLLTHIDDGAIDAVGALYERLGLVDRVLDLMSSWISHFRDPPTELVVLGMNDHELRSNAMATERVIQDLNVDPVLPFADRSFDAVTCCVSVDYLARPIEVFAEVNRILVPGGTFVCTFSNRCFPTKAIHGWLGNDDAGRCRIVAEYFRRSAENSLQSAATVVCRWDQPTIELCTPTGSPGDPLYAVWAKRATGSPAS